MKKKLLPLLIILLLTGCSKVDKKTTQYANIVNSILSYNNHNVNTASIGYKYYTPIGVDLIYDGNLNKKLKVKDTKLVLYVDVVSYYYKNKLNYEETNVNAYYYSKIKDGYIYIEKNEDNYYLKIIYNYAKIESYVEEDKLVDIIAYSTIILNSINYNDTLISNFIEQGVSFGNEITYEIKKPEDSKSTFSQHLQEYVQKNSENEEIDANEFSFGQD